MTHRNTKVLLHSNLSAQISQSQKGLGCKQLSDCVCPKAMQLHCIAAAQVVIIKVITLLLCQADWEELIISLALLIQSGWLLIQNVVTYQFTS